MRAWLNGRADLVGNGGPLAGGAYLRSQRSPASGAYAVMVRQAANATRLVAEDTDPSVARVQALCYAGTAPLAEQAASGVANAWMSLTGIPEPCGDSGVTVLVSDNLTGPSAVPLPADSGEAYCFQVGADFVLRSEA